MSSRTVRRTLPFKINSLTNRKEQLLSRELDHFNQQIHDNQQHDLYTANRQQANQLTDINEDTEHPLVLRNDVFRIEHDPDTTIARYWAKIPVYDPEKGHGNSIWIPVHVPPYYKDLLDEGERCDSELVRKNGDWYLHYVVETTHKVAEEFEDVLALDLGARHMATSVALSDRSTTFYGENIRSIREHYKQLRKSVGTAKITSGKQWLSERTDDESRRVEQELHEIANSIVEEAVERDAVIAVGDLGGIRKDNDKGRYVNDKTHKMPFAKLVNILEYKAWIAGTDIVLVDEYDTSSTCCFCGEQDEVERVGQGLFECGECGLEDNADKNGALNIAKRALGKDICRELADVPLSTAGTACVTQSRTQVVLERSLENDEPVNSLSLQSNTASRSTRSPRL
jgi:putative transposase